MNSRSVPAEEVAVPPFHCPPAHSRSHPFPQCPVPSPLPQENDVLPESGLEPELDWSQILNDGQSSSQREPIDPFVSEPSAAVASQSSAETFLPAATHNRALVNRGQGKPCYVRVTPWPNVDVAPLPPQQVLERTNTMVPTGLATPIVSPALEIDPEAPALEVPTNYNASVAEQRQIPFVHADGAVPTEGQASFGSTIDAQVRTSFSPSNVQYVPCSRADFVSSSNFGDVSDAPTVVPSTENLGVEIREVRRTIVTPLQNPLVSAENSTDDQFVPSAPSLQPLEVNSVPLNRASDSDAASQTGHSSLSDVRREFSLQQQMAAPSKQRTSALHKRFLQAAARSGFVSRRNANSEEASTVDTEPSQVVSLIPNEVDVVPVKLIPAKSEGRIRLSGLRQSNQMSSFDEGRRSSKGRSHQSNIPRDEPENYSSSDRDSKSQREKQRRFKRNDRNEYWEGERGRYQRRGSASRHYQYSGGEDEEEEVRQGRRDSWHSRPRSRASIRSAYDERDEYDEYRYPTYESKGNRMVRSLSRMSDRDDWHSDEYGRSYKTRYRPKSAQPEFWESRNDSDEADCYEEERRYQRQDRKVHGQENVLLSDPRMRTLWQIPAWRHYLNEHRRQCGYFPTYDQLRYYTLAQQQQQQPAMVANVAQSTTMHTAPTGQFIRPPNSANFSGALLTPVFPATSLPTVLAQPKLPAEPYLHTRPHSICCFGSGGHLVTYGQPKGVKGISTVVEIRNLRSYLLDERIQSDIALIDAFPGPLDAEKTAKDAVLHYCTKRLEQLKKSYEHRDHHNMLLMFQFFVLMVRQNGIVSGKDLAHMLLDTCDDGFDYGEKGLFEEEGQADVVSDSDSDFVIPLRVETNDNGRSVVSRSVQTTDVAEQEFTRLLLRGYIKEAMDWAIKTKLWGHALFLAMKMNKHMHTTVMTRFANSVPMDSPLQTLYQMLSGGVPYASTRLPDKSWIEWRPHLAMILANLTSHDEEMRQRELYGVLTMGHTLFNCGQIFGSQFCYICCHLLANWNIFESGQGGQQQQQSPLITLVGVDSAERDCFAIQNCILTEILEYTIGLHWLHTRNCFFWILPFQYCKLQFTTRLAELGYREETISYCKVLNKALQYQSAVGSIPSLSFCLSLYELSSMYHRFDPDSEVPVGIPEWIHSLGLLCEQLKSSSGQVEPVLTKAEAVSQENTENITSVSTRSDVSNVINANVNASFEGETLVVQSQATEYGYATVASRLDAPATGFQHATQMSTSTAVKQQSFLEQQQQRRGSNDSKKSEPSAVFHSVQTVVATETRSQVQERFFGISSETQSSYVPPSTERTLGALEVSQQRKSEELRFTSGAPSAGSAFQQPDSAAAEAEASKRTPMTKRDQQQSWIGKTMGGFIHRLIPKGPNEMILPDDSQKTIVWDKEKERWVDVTAADGDAAEHVAPPPSATTSPADQPEMTTSYSATPVYSGVKARRYVDVVKSADRTDTNTSSIPPPQPFSVSGEAVAAPQTYWMPQSRSEEGDVVSPFTEAAAQEDTQQSMGVPFMDPARYASS
ncbi:Transport protein Sec16A [Trichuris trichiura]|uniref:Protein transport protein sec16 n=1 Tax=Trichuris trichiura TaxID=36087 RepID=A0A077YZW6_TRITR|nr:Transport protein Sec16A [Trichuris trichiura]